MLNKNQSNKRNYWKYALVLPLLGAFVFFFQVKVIAQEKASEPTAIAHSKTNENSVDIYKINKNTTDAELKEKTNALKEKYGVTLAFSDVERNSENELTAIKVELKKGKEISKKMATKGTEAIKTFGIIVSKDENGLLTVDFGTDDSAINQKSVLISPNAPSVLTEKEIFINGSKMSQEDLDKLDPNEIESVDVVKKSDKGTIRIVTKKFSKMLNDNDIYINGEKTDKNELLLLDQNSIDKMDVNKNEKTIRITTKTVAQSSDGLNIPTPPTPPAAPTFKFKNPKPPVFPKAPKAPKGDPIHGDKKAWKEFENQMEEFSKKMEAMEPEMKAFEKKMEEFDKQMEPFNAEMEAFDKKMKIYEQQMEEYQSSLNAKKGK
jgi:hypothetical protein